MLYKSGPECLLHFGLNSILQVTDMMKMEEGNVKGECEGRTMMEMEERNVKDISAKNGNQARIAIF